MEEESMGDGLFFFPSSTLDERRYPVWLLSNPQSDPSRVVANIKPMITEAFEEAEGAYSLKLDAFLLSSNPSQSFPR